VSSATSILSAVRP